ncbi:endoribonuclease MazF [Rugamonas aquatica]|uniref:Endoribonuclease MazF n=1 Tax=Rugamonas aquatica TaxID=2743357 RepID=A0A6A7NAP1_9BURK|nr:endoribonuclease MazF [Rugamonas aquatica]MQA42136.1 endoribonuclease MazF [Rugamonas aquatica]
MVTNAYIPDRGDVVWLDFTPQAGHEQAGRRPALVLSVASYNAAAGLAVCCPVTNQAKGYPFEVPAVPASQYTLTGVVLADHVRSVDWRARNARKFAEVTSQCAHDVSTRIKLLLP